MGEGGREAADDYFRIYMWEPGYVVMSLSFTETGQQVRGSSEFSLVHVQPVLGPLNNTFIIGHL